MTGIMTSKPGFGILSWNDPLSLRGALTSYRDAGLFDLFGEVLICFQEVSAEDRALADEFDVPFLGSPTNDGIYGGFKKLAEAMTSDTVILVENDCPLIENLDEAKRQIAAAHADIKAGRAHQYRFRHRWHPGQRFQLATKYRQFYQPHDDGGEDTGTRPGLEALFRPLKKRSKRGGAIYVEKHPDKRFPEVITRTDDDNFIVDSSVLNWTNQSIMVDRRFYLDTILRRVETHPSSKALHGFQDIERALRSKWWQKQHFKIGVSNPGLFTHRRLFPEDAKTEGQDQ